MFFVLETYMYSSAALRLFNCTSSTYSQCNLFPNLQLAWCCGSTACSLCCASCPSCRNSTSTRIMYAVMLLVGSIVACIFLAPGLQSFLKEVSIAEFIENGNRRSIHSTVLPRYLFAVAPVEYLHPQLRVYRLQLIVKTLLVTWQCIGFVSASVCFSS